MCIQCAICGEKGLVKEGKSLCVSCGDAIRRLLWVAQENPEWSSASATVTDESAAEDLASLSQDPSKGLLARLGWALRFD